MKSDLIMNNQEMNLTKEEILQVFALYYKAPIAIFDDKQMPLRWVPAHIEGIDFYTPAIICERVTRTDIEKIKLILKQIRYMSDMDIYKYCRAYYNFPFINSGPGEWKIDKAGDIFEVRQKDYLHAYRIDINTGNIQLLRALKPSSLGRQSYAIQWLINNRYAIPLSFANGKNAFELKIAIPDCTYLNDLLIKINGKDFDLTDWHNDKMFRNIDLSDVEIYNSYVSGLQNQVVTL